MSFVGTSLDAIVITRIVLLVVGNSETSSIAYLQLVQQLIKAVESGNFTLTLQKIAIQLNATEVQQATVSAIVAASPVIVNPNPTRSPTTLSVTAGSSADSSTLSTGAVAGIAVASVIVGLALIGGSLFFFCCSRIKRNESIRVLPHGMSGSGKDQNDLLAVGIYDQVPV
jgi:hypothetical protein